MEYQKSQLYTGLPLSGQAELLLEHPNWVIAWGMTSRLDSAATKMFDDPLVGDQVLHVVLPTQTVHFETRKGEQDKLQTLFPGYFFLGVSSPKPAWWELEEAVSEIAGFLCKTTGEEHKRDDPPQVALLSPQEREYVAYLVATIPDSTLCGSFTVGQRVRIAQGPFSNLIGNIVEIDAARKKAKINIEVDQAVFPTWVSLWDLERK